MTTGSLQTKGGKYYAVVCFNVDGQQTQKWINTGYTVVGNKKRAEQFLKQKIEEFDEVKDVQETKLLFCDFLNDWLEIHRANVEAITYAGYKRILKQVYPYFKKLNVSLVELTPMQIHKYYALKLKSVSPNSVLKHHALIRTALEYAKKMRMVKENVADLVEKPKKQKFVGSFYNQDEICRLLEVMKGSVIEAPLMFAVYFGLRRSEIVGVKWKAIDFVNRTLTINHKVVPVNDDGTYRLDASNTLKTSSSYRAMPLDDSFYNYLIGLKEQQDSNKGLFRSSYNPKYSEYVCVNAIGNLLMPNYVTRQFKQLLLKNGMRVIRFHDLRHSCASLLLHLGYSMKDIQLWLGHGDIGTTMNIYAHIDPSNKINMVNGIAKALKI